MVIQTGKTGQGLDLKKIQGLPTFVLKRNLKTTTQRTMREVEWPEGTKCPVCLSFDYDAQIGMVAMGYGNKLISISEGEFGPRVGIWRILDLLDKYDVKATFFVPGWTADNYPESVEEIDRRGHEVAHHGYSHLSASKLTFEQEKCEIEAGIDVFKRLIGKTPKGYRPPAGEYSQNTIELLLKYHFVYDSAFLADDIPYWWVIDKKEIQMLEIPFSWILNDWMHYIYMIGWPAPRIPSEVANLWNSEFDGLYELGRLCVLCCHPFLSGRASRMNAIESFIRHVKSFPDVWFARLIDIADYWRQKYPPNVLKKS